MIHRKRGNILIEDVEALVNTVNCVGVTGRGLALQFKKAFPENFKAYAAACKRNEVRVGRMFVFEASRLTNPRFIINFPTKRHWRSRSRLEDIESGLAALAEEITRRGIRSIAVPSLGCGLGGLRWSDVRPRIEDALSANSDLVGILFEPAGPPAATAMARDRSTPPMTRGQAVLIGLMDRYQRGMLDPFLTLLEVHKLMYFMQAAGEPLEFRFKKARYGPDADNLRHVLNRVEGHYVSGFLDGGEMPEKTLSLLDGAVDKADVWLSRSGTTRARFDRVAQLIDGFESAFGLELLATVHWVLTREDVGSTADLIALAYAWGEHKRKFSPWQIELAADVLVKQGWAKPFTSRPPPLRTCACHGSTPPRPLLEWSEDPSQKDDHPVRVG